MRTIYFLRFASHKQTKNGHVDVPDTAFPQKNIEIQHYFALLKKNKKHWNYTSFRTSEKFVLKCW